ncbi:MAG: ABC transporter ATP-binding protein [Acidimicrobiia bacterium]
MLEVDGLQVAYGDLQVVWEVTFSVPKGALVALIGPNGAGKTTTLRAIMGLLPIRAGDVRFQGESIVGRRTHEIVESGLAMIQEERATFASLTVDENLELGAYTKRARPHRQAMMREVFDTFPVLAGRRTQLAGTLSGGERQMLAIGKALMARPEMLILDEPSLGLAPIVLDSTFAVIQRIRDRGVSVLLVEQLVELALDIADHAYLMELGRVVGDGSSRELMEDRRVRDAYLSL